MDFINIDNNAENIIDEIREKNYYKMFVFCHQDVCCFEDITNYVANIDELFVEYFNKYVEKIAFMEHRTRRKNYHHSGCRCDCENGPFDDEEDLDEDSNDLCNKYECFCPCLNPDQCHSKCLCCDQDVDQGRIMTRKYFFKLKDDNDIYILSTNFDDPDYCGDKWHNYIGDHKPKIQTISDDELVETINKNNKLPAIINYEDLDDHEYFDYSLLKAPPNLKKDVLDDEDVWVFQKIAAILLYLPSVRVRNNK